MLVIPAIDILDGNCVRLYMGDYDSAEVYEGNPADVARAFEEAGAQRIHIVDLNAARTGSSENRRVIRKIRRAVNCLVEVGGGIRTDGDIEHLLEIGVDRLVIGTILAKEPKTVEDWVARFGQKFVGGIDALRGVVKISGWEQDSQLSDIDLARRCKELGLISLIYTNISRDGTLEGPDIERTQKIAQESGLPVILSGGISSAHDIQLLAEGDHPGIAGVITGKAIYKNRINIAEVIQKYQKDPGVGGVW